jgi:hypothetical protein
VPGVDEIGPYTFGARRADVVLVLHVEHRRPRDARDDRQRDRAERDRRQHEVLQRVHQRFQVAGQDRVEHVEARRMAGRDQRRAPPDSRQPAELHREDVLEDDREEEDRDRDPEQRRDQARVIDGPAVPLGRDEAEWDPQTHRDEHRRQRQLDRRRELLLELGKHRAARPNALAEVVLERDRFQVAPVLNVERLVEPVLLADLGDARRCGALAEQSLGRAAGQCPDPAEDQDRQTEEDRDEKKEPADDESQHVARRTLID